MSLRIASVFSSTIALLCCLSAWADEPRANADISTPLLAAIRKISPNAAILQPNEVDAKGCAPVPKSPALARADFNGDGLEDAAVLLKTFVSGEITIWQGQELRRAYLARPLDKFPGHIPVGAFVDLKTSGKIRPLGAKRDIILSNPAVVLTYCEKSAAVYVVTGTRVKEIPLSD